MRISSAARSRFAGSPRPKLERDRKGAEQYASEGRCDPVAGCEAPLRMIDPALRVPRPTLRSATARGREMLGGELLRSSAPRWSIPLRGSLAPRSGALPQGAEEMLGGEVTAVEAPLRWSIPLRGSLAPRSGAPTSPTLF